MTDTNAPIEISITLPDHGEFVTRLRVIESLDRPGAKVSKRDLAKQIVWAYEDSQVKAHRTVRYWLQYSRLTLTIVLGGLQHPAR